MVFSRIQTTISPTLLGAWVHFSTAVAGRTLIAFEYSINDVKYTMKRKMYRCIRYVNLMGLYIVTDSECPSKHSR